jgi:hypothetical protein
MNAKGIYERLIRSRWELGFIIGGLDGVFSDKSLDIQWVKNPFRDRWFADPFILDVTDQYIYLLVEEFQFSTKKGRIAKLTICRESFIIEKYDILLELPTHLSFPNILRHDGKVFVYPESCGSRRLDLYEYNEEKETLVYRKTLLEEPVWDSSILDYSGVRYLFTAKTNDFFLDIYKWSKDIARFEYFRSIESQEKISRMAGQFFEYNGNLYCPSQDCRMNYGGAVVIKEVIIEDGNFKFINRKRLVSPHKKRSIALHTLNEYKGIVVIDVGGYDFPLIGPFLHKFVHSHKSKATL